MEMVETQAMTFPVICSGVLCWMAETAKMENGSCSRNGEETGAGNLPAPVSLFDAELPYDDLKVPPVPGHARQPVPALGGEAVVDFLAGPPRRREAL